MIRYLLVFLFSLSSFISYAQHEVPPTTEFEVTGLVKNHLKISIGSLAAFRQDALGDVVIKNKRGEQKGIAKQLKGVLLKAILDSAGITVDKPKEYGELAVILTASDGYINVYSWNELFNAEGGNHVYVITEMDGKSGSEIHGSILVLSLSDFNTGSRHLKGLAKIEVRKLR